MDDDGWRELLDSWPAEPGPKACGAPSRSSFGVTPAGDRLRIANLACGEPAGHAGPHRARVEWER